MNTMMPKSIPIGILFLIMIITGLLPSIDKLGDSVTLANHKIFPYLAIRFTVAAVFLILK